VRLQPETGAPELTAGRPAGLAAGRPAGLAAGNSYKSWSVASRYCLPVQAEHGCPTDTHPSHDTQPLQHLNAVDCVVTLLAYIGTASDDALANDNGNRQRQQIITASVLAATYNPVPTCSFIRQQSALVLGWLVDWVA